MPEVVDSFAKTLVKDFAESAVKGMGGKIGGVIADAILGALGLGGGDDAVIEQKLDQINSKLDSMQTQLNTIEDTLSTDFELLEGLVDYATWSDQNNSLNNKSITAITGYWSTMVSSSKKGSGGNETNDNTWASNVIENIVEQDVMNNIHNNVVGQDGALSVLTLYANVLKDAIDQGLYNTDDATQNGTPDKRWGFPSTEPLQSYINYYSSLATAQLKAAIMIKTAYVVQGDLADADTQYTTYLQNIQGEQQAFLSGLTALLVGYYSSYSMACILAHTGSQWASPEITQELTNQYERDMFCLPKLFDWKTADPLQGYAYEAAEAAITNFLPVNPATGSPSARIAVYQVEDTSSNFNPPFYEPVLLPGDNVTTYAAENVDIEANIYQNRDLLNQETYTIRRRSFWISGFSDSNPSQTFYLQNNDGTFTNSSATSTYFQGYEQYLQGGAGITVDSDTALAVVRLTPYVGADFF